MRDWLCPLGFEVESAVSAVTAGGSVRRWLARFEWMDSLGERWWPISAPPISSSVKRVHSMRLIDRHGSPRWRAKIPFQ
jgi:hypothetical protein